jgi:ribonuclease Z
LKVTILGNNSALPAFGRYPTAQVVEVEAQLFLVDCGEGAQMRMQKFDVKSDRINHIFISHVHGDHYLGLVGFISSLSLKGRTRDLFIFCPKELKKIIDLQLPWDLGFKLIFHFLEDGKAEVLVEAEKINIQSFPVYHSVPTHGFLFVEKKRNRILLPEKLREFEIPKYFYKQLTDGADYERQSGEVVKNEWVSEAGLPNKVYAYAADTRYAPEIVAFITGADLLYHETTYLHDLEEKAKLRMHSTTLQAAQIAKQAGVKKLIIGHFSSKYKNLEPFVEEAITIFEHVELAIEGITFTV